METSDRKLSIKLPRDILNRIDDIVLLLRQFADKSFSVTLHFLAVLARILAALGTLPVTAWAFGGHMGEGLAVT